MNTRSGTIPAMLLVALCAAGAANASEPTSASTGILFELAGDHDLQALQGSSGIYPQLQALLSDPASAQVQVVKVNAASISPSTKTLRVPLSQGKAVTFRLRRADPPAPGMEGWVGDVLKQPDQKTSPGEVDFDPFTWVSLVRNGDQIVGSINVDGQAYRLAYVGAGQHVLVKLDASKGPSESEPELSEVLKQAAAAKTPKSAHSTIRVLFFTTKERRMKTPNYQANLAAAMQDANQVMINSRVPVTFEMAGSVDSDYEEGTKTGVQQFDDFKTPGRALNQEVVRMRQYLLADLVSLYTSYPGTGGQVAGGGYSIIGSWETLAHEFGHHLGAAHGWNGTSPGYHHGYQHELPKFHTRMVTTWGSIPYFSSPNLYYQGIRIGTPEHHDVVRTINERREGVENTYPAPSTVPLVTLYERSNFSGNSCKLYLQRNKLVAVGDTYCRSVMGSPYSLKVSNFRSGHKLCVRNADDSRNRCFSGAYQGDFEVRNLDVQGGLPEGLTRTAKGYPMNGAVTHIQDE
ncbi:reprolysin-like metallopeptidase [Pseudomonas sp. LS_2]|uniref:reprolysin-like metallopeptidase n=1 Tax=Pseudomonas sp. LS_2 TaxID=3055789 RepID=UPI00364612D8